MGSRTLHALARGCVLTSIASFAACEDGVSPSRPPQLEYVVETFDVRYDSSFFAAATVAVLGVEVAVVHTGGEPAHLTWRGCGTLEASLPSGSAAAWRSENQLLWRWGVMPPDCVSIAGIVGDSLFPGDTLHNVIWSSTELAQILADSLPAGPYSFRAIHDVGYGIDTVVLGTLDLPVSRYPVLPSPLAREGFGYEPELEPSANPSGDVTVRLLVRSFVDRAVTHTFVESCPMQIYAFADTVAQTTIPEPEPSWRWPETCGQETLELLLLPSDSMVFLDVLSRSELLTSGVPAGSYALTGIFDVDARPLRLGLGSLQLGP
jgi:hypothetical protein